VLADEAGPAAKALELSIVTAVLSPRLVDRLLQRNLARHTSSLVYVDATSFADTPPSRLDVEIGAQILRLERGGVPVVVLRRGDDLADKLGPQQLAAVGG
jgi:hypothetical protein